MNNNVKMSKKKKQKKKKVAAKTNGKTMHTFATHIIWCLVRAPVFIHAVTGAYTYDKLQ